MKLPPFLPLATAALALALHPAPSPAQAAAEVGPDDGPTEVSITEETFSLPLAEADHLLRSVPSDALRYARLRELLAAGQARLERLIILRTKSGQRAVSESIDELRYGTEFRPPAPNQPPPPAGEPAPPASSVENGGIPIAFETRNVGDTIEIEPVIGPDNQTIELSLVPQSVRFIGDRTEGGPHPVKIPIFETAKVTTSVSVRSGQPFFLSTLNPPFGNGLALEKKEQRVWLDFITAEVVRPDRAENLGAALTLARAQGVRLPRIEFRDATVSEAVDFLRRKGVENDPAKKGVNFVLKAPPALAQTKITLSLTDVTLYEAARYVANLATLVVEPEEAALLLRVAGEER